MKTCVTCKHLEKQMFTFFSDPQWRKCIRPTNPKDPVTGEMHTNPAWRERLDMSVVDSCGEKGKYWESK